MKMIMDVINKSHPMRYKHFLKNISITKHKQKHFKHCDLLTLSLVEEYVRVGIVGLGWLLLGGRLVIVVEPVIGHRMLAERCVVTRTHT